MHLHIDGDVVKYRAGFAAEKMHYWLDEVFKVNFDTKKSAVSYCEQKGVDPKDIQGERIAEPVSHALQNVRTVMDDIQMKMGTNSLTVYLSGATNYRNELGTIIYKDTKYAGYKANRADAPRPVHGDAIVEYLIKHYAVNMSENEEADDAMGISHYHMWLRDTDSSCIVTVDKDLNMIPGWHYNFVKQERYNIDTVTADTVFWRQLLTGDTTDNIPGLKGVGAVTAEKLIDWNIEPLDAYAICLEEYKKQFGEDAPLALLENARMIWIRREPDELWNPPT